MTKDKENGNKTLSRHLELYRDKEYKEALEIMSRNKTLLLQQNRRKKTGSMSRQSYMSFDKSWQKFKNNYYEKVCNVATNYSKTNNAGH